ncbi:hypothetical protein KZ483_24045 [Paenibacillus sp. sptzw28]|uniref:hypothetical protein n=1 Tax=Paenibacillus sp. sptzw28 TaxID=715179 RepID=UPI001C6EDEB8|nr:hypothetical protein [Paenibacillus sp. sptzw28]QYR20795.1 hypothetical protein KZ483_24045 [Paenibacillus sp. sptzw28]
MAYTKTNWLDRAVQFVNRFTKSNETSTSVTLTADPGTVTQAGTPINASNLNKMEQGIFDAHDKTSGRNMPGGDCNNATSYGDWLFTDTTLNSPWPGRFGAIRVFVSSGDTYNGSTNWLFQVAYNTADMAVKHRHKINNGAWSSWEDFVTSAGGTIKADLIFDSQADTANSWSRGIFFTVVDSAGVKQTSKYIIEVNPTGNPYFTHRGVAGYKMWHAGNDGDGSGLDADLFKGMGVSAGGLGIVKVGSDGVAEIGQYVDFHRVGSAADFDGRMSIDANNDLFFAKSGGATFGIRNNNGVFEMNNGGTWTPVGGIKNVQRGQSAITLTNGASNVTLDVTISSVAMSKTFVASLFDRSLPANTRVDARLTTATNLQLYVYSTSGTFLGQTATIDWEIAESY